MPELPDPITNEWFFVRSLKLPLCLLILYIWFVLKAGPHAMKNSAAFSLKKTILVYNFTQVVLCMLIVIEGWSVVSNYNLKCQPVDFSRSPQAIKARKLFWYMYMTKYLDLLDTVFFVLRKKGNQITCLHVFHHVFAPLFAFIYLKYQPGGHSVLMGVLNATVHVFMYLYYGIAALGPKYQQYLWWKRHLTEMQLIQFVIIFVHSGQLYFRDCNYPLWLVHAQVCTSIVFFCLFGNFYYKTYLSDKKKISIKDINQTDVE